MKQQYLEICHQIFALFVGLEANVIIHNNSAFIQAKPVHSGSWKYKGWEVKTITFYPTTTKLMVQGRGVQTVINCSKINFLDRCKEVVFEVCKLNHKEANEVSLEDLAAAAEFFDSIHDKQERMFTSEELHESENLHKRTNNFKYGSLEDFI